MEKRLPSVSRWIIAADLFSDIGNQFITMFLVDLLVFKGNNAISSLVLLCLIHQLPSVLLSPLAGRGVDRLGPGRWMTLITLSKCLLVGAFALVTTRWALFIVYLMFVTASLFFSIGRLSAIALFIPRQGIIRFNALNERLAIGGAILSPWLIGMILSRTNQTTTLALAALVFATTVLLLATLSDPRQAKFVKKRKKTLTGVNKFERNVVSLQPDQSLKACFLMLGIVILGGGILYLGMPLLFKTTLNGDIASWGFVLSAFQAGALLSTLILPRCSMVLEQKNVSTLSFLLLGTTLFILPFVDSCVQLAGLMTVFGCGFTLLQLYWESRIQENSSLTAIGKIMSLMSAFKGMCYLSAVLCGAVISSLWGVESFLMIGALALGSASFIARRF